jgi:hypothetical protein
MGNAAGNAGFGWVRSANDNPLNLAALRSSEVEFLTAIVTHCLEPNQLRHEWYADAIHVCELARGCRIHCVAGVKLQRWYGGHFVP